MFEKSMFGLGFLDVSGQNEHLISGTKMELPLWMALYLSKAKFVSCELPKPYQETQRNILVADSSVVDLFKQVQYFYDTGIKLLELKHPECPTVGITLIETFVGRFKKIMDMSQNSKNKDLSVLCQKLEMYEKELFELNRSSVKGFEQWERRESNIVQASSLVIQNRKRKRDVT